MVSERPGVEEPGFLVIRRPSVATAGLCALVVIEASQWLSSIPEGAAITAKAGIVGTVLMKECVRRGR